MIETLKQIDTEWFFAINQHARNGLFDLLCPFIRTQSNWYLAYAVIIYVMFNQYGKRAWWLLLAIAITIITSDQLSGNLIKNLVQRLRPCNDPIIGQQVHLLVNCGKGFSFVQLNLM